MEIELNGFGGYLGVDKVKGNFLVYDKVSVKDYGEGIPDENKEAVFERFVKGGKKGVKGTGLGLAIIKRIVDLHGGKVWVEDNPEGKGSVFYFRLPKEG